MLAGWPLRQGSRPTPFRPLAPNERREQEARDQLRQHLGRQDRLRRMDKTPTQALRVHRAIDLPRPAESAAVLNAETRTPDIVPAVERA